MQSRASRVVRGWIAGSFATGVAALSHGIADGAAPSALALGVALVFAGILGTFVVGHRPSLPRLVAIVGTSQLAFHLVFSFLTPGTAGPSGHHGAAGHITPALAHHVPDAAMWAGHALAMIATIVFLRRAELAVWNLLAEALEAATVARVPAIVARTAARRPSYGGVPRHPRPSPFLSVLSRRGPPATACA